MTPDATRPKRNPSYHVYTHKHDADNTERAWVLVADNVTAPNRREAVVRATSSLPEAERYGAFLVVLDSEVRVLNRAPKTIIADDWSAGHNHTKGTK